MSEFLFKPKDFFPQCHGATIEHLPDGRLISAWFAGTKEANADTAIWHSILTGNKWEDPTVLVKARDEAHWNPVLFNSNDGFIHLFFKIGESPEKWRTYRKFSTDGKHWSNPILLVRGKNAIDGRGPVRSKPIILPDGAWLAPASREITIEPEYGFIVRRPDVIWDSFTDRSEDGGKTWQRSPFVPLSREKYGGVIQPTIWNKSNGTVGMFMRSTYGYVFKSESNDGGKTWIEASKTIIPNNNSGIDVLKLKCGILVMALNPVSGNWAKRTPLSVMLSTDDGETWGCIYHLEDTYGSYSYPIMVETEYGFDVVYTWNRLSIVRRQIEIIPPKNGEKKHLLRMYYG